MAELAVTAKYICPDCGVHDCTPDCRHVPTTNVGKIPPNRFCRAWNAKRQKYCSMPAGAKTAHLGTGRCGYANHGGNNSITVGNSVGINGRYANIKHKRIRELSADFAKDPDPLNALPELATTRALFVDFVERYSEWSAQLQDWWESWKQSSVINPQAIALLCELVDELEAQLGEDAEEWAERIDAARTFLEKLRDPANGKRPRNIMDISDAHRILGEIRQQIDSIHKREAETHIAKRDFFRVLGDMGRVVDLTVTPENLALGADEIKRKIKDGWLGIYMPS